MFAFTGPFPDEGIDLCFFFFFGKIKPENLCGSCPLPHCTPPGRYGHEMAVVASDDNHGGIRHKRPTFRTAYDSY